MLTVPEGEMPESPRHAPEHAPEQAPEQAQQQAQQQAQVQRRSEEPEPAGLWPGQLVELPDGPVYVRTAKAEGVQTEPVLFVHGLGGSSTNWTDLMHVMRAAGKYACTALDLPGFGFSPPPPGSDYSILAHTRTVISLVEHLGQRQAHLIGNSMGGAVLTKVAARRPDLVASLTLISPALPDLRPRVLPMRLAVVAVPGVGRVLLDRIAKQPAAGRTDLSIAELYYDPGRMPPLRRDQEVAEVIRRDGLEYANDALRLSARGLVAEYFKVGRRSLWRDAAAVTAPALIVHGSADRLVNPVMAVKAARTFPNPRVVILPGVGHVAMMEKPQAAAREIESFLDQVRAANGRHVMNRVRC